MVLLSALRLKKFISIVFLKYLSSIKGEREETRALFLNNRSFIIFPEVTEIWSLILSFPK